MLQINCQFNYKIGCNWNINGHQYMTHNNNYLCISIPSKVKKSLVWNEGVKTSAHLWAQCQWWSSVRSNPLSNQSQNHKYPKLLSIPVLNRAYSRGYVPRSTEFGMLKPIEMEDAKVNEISWTKVKKLNKTTMNISEELHHFSQTNTELLTIPPWSSFQLEPNNHIRQSVILKDAQVPQEDQDKLYFLLQNKCDSIMSKSSTDIGRTNLFKWTSQPQDLW